MKRSLAAVLLCLLSCSLSAQVNMEMERTVREVAASQGMQHASLSVCLYDVATNQKVYGYDEQRSMIPASVEKLITTGVGFAQLGKSFRFTTRLLMYGDVDREGVLKGDLYIVGGGDPLLGSYRYRQTTADTLFTLWTRALQSRGVQRVDGRIRYVTSIFDGPQQHDSWQHGDVGNYYGAGAVGLNFHENMYFAHFNAGSKVGAAATLCRTVPKNLDLVEVNEVGTGVAGSGDGVVAYGLPWFSERFYRGTVPLGAKDFAVRIALPQPAKACADQLSTFLRTHGISVAAAAEEALSSPDSVRTVSEYFSPYYKTIAQYTNHTSNNIYAEAIFKYLGYKQSGVGSFESGREAIESYLKTKDLDLSGVSIIDGCGLSRMNRTTADFMCRYLSVMAKESFADDFRQSLPRVGESGTAKNLLPTLPKDITVMLKTGTMDGVKCYAGYFVGRQGTLMSFAVFANNYDCSSKQATEALNKILQKMATSY